MIDPNLPGSTTVQEEEEILAERQRLAAVRALRRFVSRHNWHAITLSLFALFIAAFLWGFVYLFIYWFSLVTLTISRSFNADTLLEVNDPHLVSARFPWYFLGAAVIALAIARVVRRRVRMESLREARHYFLWVVVELLMAIPNVTFSIWGNLSALVRLRRSEAANAWRLLEHVNREGGRLSMSSLRLEIDDERQLQNVVFALQIVGLVEVREKREGWFLCLQNRDAYALLSRAGAAN